MDGRYLNNKQDTSQMVDLTCIPKTEKSNPLRDYKTRTGGGVLRLAENALKIQSQFTNTTTITDVQYEYGEAVKQTRANTD